MTAVYTLDGYSGPPPTFQWGYDSGGRLTSITYPDGEQVNYEYDGAWRPISLCSTRYNPCYVQATDGTTSTAYAKPLDQPTTVLLGNSTIVTNSFNNAMMQLTQMQVGVVGNPNSIANRSYTYDAVGNVQTISDLTIGQTETQTFGYDALNCLNHWQVTGSPNIDVSYGYDKLGNLTNNAGVTYSYGSGSGGPYAVRSTSTGQNFVYDANGNMMAQQGGPGPARTIAWNSDNQPSEITSSSTPDEYYSYDADGGRIKRVAGGVTTYTMEGLWEEDWLPGDTDQPSTTRSFYSFNGQVVAERTQSSRTPTATPTATWYGHPDGHADQYAHQHADQYPDQHADQHRDADGHRHADQYSDTDPDALKWAAGRILQRAGLYRPEHDPL